MKSDTPDELFVFPDSPSIGEPNSSFSVPDFDDCKIRDYCLATLPWPPRPLFVDEFQL